MNKGTVIRAGIIFSLFVIILGAAWIISTVKDRNDEAVLTNSENAYLTVEDYTITKGDLWTKMRLIDGVSYLQQYVERNYLYVEELKTVTDDEIDEKIEYYTYGTNDPDELAEIFEDADLKAELEEQFRDGLVIINFDPDSDEDLRRFVDLEIAKEKATLSYVKAITDDEDDLFVSDEAVERYYEDNTYGDVCALTIMFNSKTEAYALFDEFKIVPNYELGWGEYKGIEDISTLSTGDFNETNTDKLDDQGVLEKYILMYNYMYPNKTQLPEDATVDTVCAASDALVYNYEEMTNDAIDGSPYATLRDYLFDTLKIEFANTRASFNVQEMGEFQVLSYKVSAEDVTPYADLTTAEKDALRDEIYDSLVDDTSTSRMNTERWDALEFEIYDPILKVKYHFDTGTKFDNAGNKEYVMTVEGDNITADTLFNFMEETIGVYYTIDMIQTKLLLDGDAFEELFDGNTNYLKSSNETVEAYVEELRGMKTSFNGNAYASYGFDSSLYTWEEFLILAFNAQSENEAILNLNILSDLQPYLSLDVINYELAEDIMQDLADNYFNINMDHLLIYTDFDEDLSPDDYNDFVDALDGADLTEYNTLKTQLENLIIDRLDDDMDLYDIVDEFNDSLLEDPTNDWADAKAYGFRMLAQNLSAEGSLTYLNTENFDEDFVAATKALYDEYVFRNETDVDLDELYDDGLFQSSFGLHFLHATKGSVFTQPTAVYGDDEDISDEYGQEADGTTLLPNQSQIDLYIAINNAEKIGEATDAILPTSVYSAVETYFGSTYNAYFSSGAYSIASLEYILNNNGTYDNGRTTNTDYLNDVLDLLYKSTFPEGFKYSQD